MKKILFLVALNCCLCVFAQESEKSETLVVQNVEGFQGSVDFGTIPEMFVGQKYFFCIINNDRSWDLKIESQNLSIVFQEDSKRTTGGLMFEVTPLDTGYCNITLSSTKQEKQVGLMSVRYHVSKYPMPPVFISGIRTGETIDILNKSVEITCKYGAEAGIFEGYSIESWTAELKGKKYSGVGSSLSKELIDGINASSGKEVLKLFVVLSENNTGYTNSDAVYLIE